MREGAIGGAGGILTGGGVEVDELEFGVVGNRDDAKGLCTATIDKSVAESNGADIESTESTRCEAAFYAVLEEVRVAAAVGSLWAQDLCGVVVASIVRARTANKLDLTQRDGCERCCEGRGRRVGARGDAIDAL